MLRARAARWRAAGPIPCCAAWQPQLRDLFARYVEAKQAQSVLDYDDRLLYWAQMVGDSELATEIGGMFDHVLVDEYQDTDRLQASILLALKPDGRGSPSSATMRNRSIPSAPRRFATSARRSVTARPSPFWTEFLHRLARRGLRGVKLVVSDAHEGLKAAITKVRGATYGDKTR
jgi:superfamily I DNA/RNA helicase